jgi:hypothetical protein
LSIEVLSFSGNESFVYFATFEFGLSLGITNLLSMTAQGRRSEDNSEEGPERKHLAEWKG